MRHISSTAALLVFVLVMLAPACVAGWNDGRKSGCHSAVVGCQRKAKPHWRRLLECQSSKTAMTRASEPIRLQQDEARGHCEDAFTAPPGQCGLRSFIQLHLVGFSAHERAIPLPAATKVALQSRVMIVISSVGPPETDRGPPRC
jgi:hypothetical protein